MLATPLTVCILVVGKHVPQLSFLGILLGSEPVFEPRKRVYQRLLAGDQEDAAELVEGYLEHQPLAFVYDTVLIPALATAETHWQLGELNEGKHTFIMQSLKELIHDQGERRRETQAAKEIADSHEGGGEASLADEVNSPALGILCLPARTEADEITALMLAQVLEAPGCLVQAIPVSSLAGELSEIVERHTADVVCVSATPPAAVMHARYLCKRLRLHFPTVKLVVGLWDAQGALTRAKERIGCGAIVVATLADAQEQIRLLTQPRLPPSKEQSQPEPGPLVLAGA